jgi:hypothetical protein
MLAQFMPLIVVLTMLWTSLAYGQVSPSSALHFTADGQSVLVPHTDAVDNISSGLTVEAWVKPESGILLRGYSSIVSKQLNGTGYMLATNNTADTSVNEHRFKAEVAGIQVTSESQPGIQMWQHVAAVWDGQLQIYVNGQLDGVINTGSPIPNAVPLWIGSSPFGADTNWRGAIDEVRIWAVARSQAEIQGTMNQTLCGNELGLRAYWSFDEGTGQVVHDTVGQSDGQIDGPEWVSGVELVRASCGTPVVPFTSFTAKVEIDLAPRTADAFELQSHFTLGVDSDGIHPLTEEVTLALMGKTGSFTTSLPVGSFTQDKQGRFTFAGTINGVKLKVTMTPRGDHRYTFEAEGERADLTGITNPVTVILTIGDDSGSTPVKAEFNKDHKGRDQDT